MDPAETHWQGPRTAAAASLHKAAAGQGDSSQDRALEAREHTLAEAADPAETHWQGHRIAAAASARGCCGAGRLSVRTEHRRQEQLRSQSCVDPADTHWQGPRTAAAASLHRAACRAGRLESRQSTGGEGTRSQSSGSRGDTLARAQDCRRKLACTRQLQGRATQVAWSQDRALGAREHARRAVDPAETLARAQDSRRS